MKFPWLVGRLKQLKLSLIHASGIDVLVASWGIMAFGAIVATPSARADRIANMIPTEARTLSMGNSGLCLLNDSYAIFYNPANLANKRVKPKFELINFQMDSTVVSINAVASKMINASNLKSLYPYLKDNRGQWGGFGYSVYPNFTSRFFSFGLLYRESYGAQYVDADQNLGTSVTLKQNGLREISPVGAVSFRLMGGVLKFGYSVKLQTLGIVDKSVSSPGTSSLDWRSGMMTAVGLNMTGGMTLTLPFKHLPTVAVVARNIGSTNHPQEKIPMNFDLGVAHTTYVGRSLHLRLALDHRDVTNRLKASRMRRLFAGAEVRLFNTLNLRGGYGQGYPSAGFSIGGKSARVEFSWSSEEMMDGLRTERNQKFTLHIIKSFLN